jgi:hypothetical protein
MQASPLTSRFKRWVTVKDWAWWQLPPVLRGYVAAVAVAAICVIGIASARTDWQPRDLAIFALLMSCGAISSSSTPRIAYTSPGGLTRDFTAIWAVPVAVLLPPVYAALVSIPFVLTVQIFVHRGVVYRRVFTAASITLSYATASWAFRTLPASLAGESVGKGLHAFTWAVAVMGCLHAGQQDPALHDRRGGEAD